MYLRAENVIAECLLIDIGQKFRYSDHYSQVQSRRSWMAVEKYCSLFCRVWQYKVANFTAPFSRVLFTRLQQKKETV